MISARMEILRLSLDNVAVDAEDGCKQGSIEAQPIAHGMRGVRLPHQGGRKVPWNATITAGTKLTMHESTCDIGTNPHEWRVPARS